MTPNFQTRLLATSCTTASSSYYEWRAHMTTDTLEDINETQRKRQAYIDFRLNFLGTISRKDLMSRFGIKNAAATRDLASYKRIANHNIEYNDTTKLYERTKAFNPVFKYSANQILTALSQGFGDDFTGAHKALIVCETPTLLNTPDISVIATLSRTIHQQKVVKISYRSLSSGLTQREIVPFALVDNGLRWHVRAYDRRHSRFSDFVLTRISDPEISNSAPEVSETREFDIQWNRIVEMQLGVHPRVDHPETIEYDYGMKDGILSINVRAALAGYVLRRWNVDCSKDHSLTGAEFHLCLKNTAALYGVENLKIAPGYTETM